MTVAPFSYLRPESLPEAAAIVAEHGSSARVLAGGQSLVVGLSTGRARPRMVVDLGGCKDGASVKVADGSVSIGPIVTYQAVADSPEVRSVAPMVAHVCGLVGNWALRSVGTPCGAIAEGDRSEMEAVCLALGASAHVAEGGVMRHRPVGGADGDGDQGGPGPTEVLAGLDIPGHSPSWSYRRFLGRPHGRPVLFVAAVSAPSGVVVVVGGLTAAPLRARAVEDALADGAGLNVAAHEVSKVVKTHLGEGDYLSHLAAVVVRDALGDLEMHRWRSDTGGR